MKEREEMIQNYIDGYNQFAVDKMVAHFDDNIKFEHIQNGELVLSLQGSFAFQQQAELAKTYFTSRQQTIRSYNHQGDETEIEIDYKAIVAMDFPNGLKRGQELQLTGKSIFQFRGNKIIQLTDIG